MLQERRGMFKVWNMFLIILTFALAVIGTFLTRAGLVSSVHAFAESDIGGYFLVFTAVVCVGSLLLLWHRLPDLRSTAQIDRVVSRETAFLANNLLFMGALFAVFWGTLFPLLSEVLTGQRVTVGPPFFVRLVIPIFWLILVVMAFGTVVGWRGSDGRAVARTLARPAVVSLLITALLFALGIRHWLALVGFSTCLFTLLVTLGEIYRGLRQRHARGEGWLTATARLFGRARRRYGGYVAHVGIVLLATGVVGSNVYQVQTEQSLGAGESLELAGYRLTFTGLGETAEPDKTRVYAGLDVSQEGRPLGRLEPGKDLFRQREEEGPMTSPAILHLPLEDVYTLLGSYDAATGRATLKVFVNPLIGLVWLGLIVLLAGTVVAAWPDASEQRVLNAELARLSSGAPLPQGSP
jgi:cytochrome c-type biogenesis protein CcmF